MRLLIADDDEATRGLLATTLRACGHEVATVPDGPAAVARYARGELDLVMLDAVMPGGMGGAACLTMKQLDIGEFVPIVLSFSKTDPRSRVLAVASGADGYICKPFEHAELMACVDTALRQRRAYEQAREAQRAFEYLKTRDTLTGAYSLRFLEERLDAEFARALRHAEPLACLVIDIDCLKVHNERGGRTAGDRILCDVAKLLMGAVRDSDVVARYGGDEFFLMLPVTHFAGALVVAARVRRDLARQYVSASEDGARVTVSVGVALFPSRDVRAKEALLTALELSLFEAKRLGGDRVCVFQQYDRVYSPDLDNEV
jgi:diguanylate cyclase (GGDEF)-like protein